ncbi:DUF5908 family protein [Chitinophagaceae bacterium 26-R-25]|nr:DUF5908 family protein [Chitinophagaceae bacterium 26-R-25]
MPIEIRELIIRANIVQEDNNNNASATSTTQDNNDATSHLEDLVNKCVEKILENLKNKNER